jgi:hypothetical protein
MTKRKTIAGNWVTNTPGFIAALPVIDFPCERLPDLFSPVRTVLQLGGGYRCHVYLWCFLRRKAAGRPRVSFDPSSQSAARVAALPAALDRLSKQFRHAGARSASIHKSFKSLGQFLAWADSAEHGGRYEAILSDPDLALQALRGHHSFLRSRMQSHQVDARTAANADKAVIGLLSTIHGREFKDHIEPLSEGKGQRHGTKAPKDEDLRAFVSRAQAVFDSAAELVLNGTSSTLVDVRRLRLSAVDDSDTASLPQSYTRERLMELACLAFAALTLADSGANLAVLQEYEEPEDLLHQLAQPDKLGLRDRAIKFRAGDKLVPVHLTALTTTRLRTYLSVRRAFVASLGGLDIRPFFLQGAYPKAAGPERSPTAIRPIDKALLAYLRRKFSIVGADLPQVTLRQLRAYKQQYLVRHEPLHVAAEMMGHSVETAVRAYSKAQEGLREAEVGQFLGSLEKTVLTASKGLQGKSPSEALPAGACADYGRPASSGSTPPVQPDCAKVEGCFFCDNYRLHADERDLRKLMSCRVALKRIALIQPDSARAQRVYVAIVDRIDALLGEIKRRLPQVYNDVRRDVDERGNLTTYWSTKLQQLHLLGMLPDQPTATQQGSNT